MTNPFATWLNSAMQTRRLSQADLARAVGVGDAQVSRWRRGQVVPNVHTLQRIADSFGVQRVTLDRLAGYPVAETLLGFNSDPAEAAVEAELQTHQAHLRRIMEEKLPRSMWKAYVDACEALADGLSASVRLNASIREVMEAPDDERAQDGGSMKSKRSLGFQQGPTDSSQDPL